jgi:hypothetical protein
MKEYMDFVATQGRSFASKTHMDASYENFHQSYHKMIEHNSGDVPFKLGINHFSDMSESEFSSKYLSQGLVLPERKKRLGYKVAMDQNGHDVVEHRQDD